MSNHNYNMLVNWKRILAFFISTRVFIWCIDSSFIRSKIIYVKIAASKLLKVLTIRPILFCKVMCPQSFSTALIVNFAISVVCNLFLIDGDAIANSYKLVINCTIFYFIHGIFFNCFRVNYQ